MLLLTTRILKRFISCSRLLSTVPLGCFRAFPHLCLATTKGRFGFTKYEVMLSTRPDKSVGSDEIWDKATTALVAALKNKGEPLSEWSTQIPGRPHLPL